jgi:hypothetical protein
VRIQDIESNLKDIESSIQMIRLEIHKNHGKNTDIIDTLTIEIIKSANRILKRNKKVMEEECNEN